MTQIELIDWLKEIKPYVSECSTSVDAKLETLIDVLENHEDVDSLDILDDLTDILECMDDEEKFSNDPFCLLEEVGMDTIFDDYPYEYAYLQLTEIQQSVEYEM